MISSKTETITTTAIYWREHSSDWAKSIKIVYIGMLGYILE
jgi:hypothetical protein